MIRRIFRRVVEVIRQEIAWFKIRSKFNVQRRVRPAGRPYTTMNHDPRTLNQFMRGAR